MMADLAEVKRRAIGLLARREHSRLELERKLTTRGFEFALIDCALNQLRAAGLQSDRRFAESYLRMRAQNGFGPIRIRQELQQRGIAAELIDQAGFAQINWQQCLHRAWQKKFSSQSTRDYPTRVKQARFLVYRGFDPDEVWRFLQ